MRHSLEATLKTLRSLGAALHAPADLKVIQRAAICRVQG